MRNLRFPIPAGSIMAEEPLSIIMRKPERLMHEKNEIRLLCYITMTNLANQGLLGNFIGMLTDSRSFVSYTRHEYFRRILCDLIGGWVEQGEYPEDWDMLERIIKGICYNNAVRFFGFPVPEET